MASLKVYQQKRKFSSTPEPKGLALSSSQKRFVIQKHAANRLHYDLRLENHGVMLSWAVPKGPSENPKNKHLAAQTEDHPLEYRHFEGVIPEGYGAGTVMVWDQGTFEWVKKSKNHYSFVLAGEKLKGEYALVRLPKAGAKAWLLLKKKDKFASAAKKIIDRLPNSVITGRSLNEIKKGSPAKKVTIRKITGAKLKAMPKKITVMKPTLISKSFNDPEWIFETKWDGFRGLALINGSKLDLRSRNWLDLKERFPELSDIKQAFAGKNVIADGEIVSLDSKGVSHFALLREDQPSRNLVYQVFDLLYLDGYDLRNTPLEERKALLRAILIPHPRVKYSDHVEAAGEDFFAEAKKDDLEGIVAKERTSIYEGKRTKQWLKIKNTKTQEFVIAGWTKGTGSRAKTIGSLVLGVYSGKELIYAGRVGSGFNEKDLSSLLSKLKKLKRSSSPFNKDVPREDQINFAKPSLVAQINFTEWTSERQLRHPVFEGLRDDKPAKKVKREIALPKKISNGKASKLLNTKLNLNKKVNQEQLINHAKLSLTNLNKPFWIRPKLQKRDLINYYYQIAPVLLPHLENRPLTLKRYPQGAAGEFFYQKNVPANAPDFIKTITVKHSQGPTKYPVANNLETLIWLANLADLEIHPWYSQQGSLNNPDFIVFDLDPTKENDLAAVRQVALLIKEVLDEFKLEGYPKSSGSRGIHVYVPIKNTYTYDQTKLFAKKVTELIHQLAPKQTTLEFRKARRHGVYIDYLQNIKGKTLASVYSLRAKPGAPVAAPLTWEEVKKGFRLTQFNIKSILPRVKNYGDLFAPALTQKQDIDAVLKRLQKLNIAS